MLYLNVRRIISYSLMFICALTFTVSTVVTAAEPASIVKKFNSSQNSVEKRELLESLENFTLEAGEKAPQWVVDLLSDALRDRSPVVVAEAAFQVGQFNVVELNTNLLSLYKESVTKFGASGYERRVQYSIIPSLGKVGNNEAKVLISDLLRKDNGTAIGNYLLEAIRNSNDPVFLNDLKLYKHKMANYVDLARGRGDDPILYSRKLAYLEFAAEIEKALTKGGK